MNIDYGSFMFGVVVGNILTLIGVSVAAYIDRHQK